MLKVMTFNLRYNEVKDGANAWPHRNDKVADLIGKYRPAVFGTQEGLFSMLSEMQQLLPEYGWRDQIRGGYSSDHYPIMATIAIRP